MVRAAEYDGTGKKWSSGPWEEICPAFSVDIKPGRCVASRPLVEHIAARVPFSNQIDGRVARRGKEGPRILVKQRDGKNLRAKVLYVPRYAEEKKKGKG